MRNPHVYMHSLQIRYFTTCLVEYHRPKIVSDMDAMFFCIFSLFCVRMRLAIACIVCPMSHTDKSERQYTVFAYCVRLLLLLLTASI